jgi:hypothetical protein
VWHRRAANVADTSSNKRCALPTLPIAALWPLQWAFTENHCCQKDFTANHFSLECECQFPSNVQHRSNTTGAISTRETIEIQRFILEKVSVQVGHLASMKIDETQCRTFGVEGNECFLHLHNVIEGLCPH